jgi:RNA polymerase sigma factor FliA
MQTQKRIAENHTEAGKKPDADGQNSKPVANGDKTAMLDQYKDLVKIIVARMRSKLPSHVDVEELESIGMMGLLAAIERYDPDRGYTFQTYASVRIRGAILDELRAMDMVPRSVRIKQRLLARASSSIEQRTGRVPTSEEMCEALQVTQEEYETLCEVTRPVTMIYLDGITDNSDSSRHDFIADETMEAVPSRMEREELQELVARKIMELPQQHRQVIALYFNEGLRLAEIGTLMGLSEARICQIRSQALEHLRRFVNRVSAS